MPDDNKSALLDSLNNYADLIGPLSTAIAVLVGGIWVLWRFGINREAYAKIEFDLCVNVLGYQSNVLLIEIEAKVSNKGSVRHWLRNFHFDLLYLPDHCSIITGDTRINDQVLFYKLLKNKYWIPPDWKGTFIDGNVSQSYTYVTSVPNDACYLLVYARFQYPDSLSEFHTAQRAWSVGQLVSKAGIPNVSAGSAASR